MDTTLDLPDDRLEATIDADLGSGRTIAHQTSHKAQDAWRAACHRCAEMVEELIREKRGGFVSIPDAADLRDLAERMRREVLP